MAKAKETPNELGLTETQNEAIARLRAARAKVRASNGGDKPRLITNYHDAERLFRLGALKPDEIVDLEERGLLSAEVLKAGGIQVDDGNDDAEAV